MSHLDTAFKIGAAQAQYDFQVELDKVAAGAPGTPSMPIRRPMPLPPEAPTPVPAPPKPVPGPGKVTPPPPPAPFK